MSWFGNEAGIRKSVTEAVERIVRGALSDADTTLSALRDVTSLRSELETLKIEKGRKDEDFARREREIEQLQQQQAALGAYTASGSAWNTATVNISNVDFNNLYAPQRQPVKIAPREKESAVEWLDRRVAEICVQL